MARPRHTKLAGQRAHKLRNDQTISEANLWGSIRNRQLGIRFRRQVPIGHWIVDFASLEHKIVIEVDDASHNWKDETDRTTYLQQQGFTILRLDNKEVAQHHNESLDRLRRCIELIQQHGQLDIDHT